jgi:hypothetical protein
MSDRLWCYWVKCSLHSLRGFQVVEDLRLVCRYPNGVIHTLGYSNYDIGQKWTVVFKTHYSLAFRSFSEVHPISSSIVKPHRYSGNAQELSLFLGKYWKRLQLWVQAAQWNRELPPRNMNVQFHSTEYSSLVIYFSSRHILRELYCMFGVAVWNTEQSM